MEKPGLAEYRTLQRADYRESPCSTIRPIDTPYLRPHLDEVLRDAGVQPEGRAVFIEPNPRNPLYHLQVANRPGMRWQAGRGILDMRPTTLRAATETVGVTWSGVRRFGFLPPFTRNTRGGGGLERSAFQIFRAAKPK